MLDCEDDEIFSLNDNDTDCHLFVSNNKLVVSLEPLTSITKLLLLFLNKPNTLPLSSLPSNKYCLFSFKSVYARIAIVPKEEIPKS